MQFAKYALVAGCGAFVVLGSRYLPDPWFAVLVVAGIAGILLIRHRVTIDSFVSPDALDRLPTDTDLSGTTTHSGL